MSKKYVPFIIAIVIAIVLGYAVYQKIFSPRASFSNFQFLSAILEILVIALLLSCFRRYEIWLCLSSLFAVWAGYSIYHLLHHEPCGCMGNAVQLPPYFNMACDIIFYFSGLLAAYILNKKIQPIAITIAITPLLLFLGYLVGK